MKQIIRQVLLLHQDQVFRARVRQACRDRFELQEISDWGQLIAEVRMAPPAALIIVDPYEGRFGAEQLSPTLQALLREFPSATVFAACEVRRGALEDVRLLGEWGITRIITLDEDDMVMAIAQRLGAGQGRRLRTLLQRALPTETPGRARAILTSAAEIVSVGGTVSDLARTMHVTTRTLLRWCLRAGLLPPRKLLAWMRILLAADLLDDPGRSVLGVALACGYSSDAALRNVMRRFLGATPKEFRRGDAFERSARAFLGALQEGRSSRRAGSSLVLKPRDTVAME